MPSTLDIRYCKKEDLTEIILLAKKSVQKVLPNENFEQDKIVDLFSLCLKNEEYTCICLEIDGRIHGYILGFISGYYFHSKKIAYCMSIFVDEEYRKYGLEMIRSFESWAKYCGAETLSISSFTGLSPDNLSKVYNKLGYKEKEVVYMKEI